MSSLRLRRANSQVCKTLGGTFSHMSAPKIKKHVTSTSLSMAATQAEGKLESLKATGGTGASMQPPTALWSSTLSSTSAGTLGATPEKTSPQKKVYSQKL